MSLLEVAHGFNFIAKVRFTLEQAMKAQKGSRGTATLSLTSALKGVGS
jgi:hypothetical protein